MRLPTIVVLIRLYSSSVNIDSCKFLREGSVARADPGGAGGGGFSGLSHPQPFSTLLNF